MKLAPIPRQRTYYHPDYVRSLFDGIAHRYDLLNHMLSGGFDFLWRRRALRAALDTNPRTLLDVATGTGDMAVAAASRGVSSVFAVDVSENMIRKAAEKAERHSVRDRIQFFTARGEELPFENDRFAAATVAFGVRNFSELTNGLSELVRVLEPGGTVSILEFSRPTWGLTSRFYSLYLRTVVPRVGRWISHSPAAYRYLPETIGEFPSGEAFMDLMAQAGLVSLRARPMTGGIVTLYSGQKPLAVNRTSK